MRDWWPMSPRGPVWMRQEMYQGALGKVTLELPGVKR